MSGAASDSSDGREAGRKSAATSGLPKRFSSAGRSGRNMRFSSCIARPDQRVEILLAAQRMQLGRPPGSPPSPPSAALDELELAAVARQPARFVATLAEALDCDPGLAQRIVDDVSGEPLAVALAALGASNEVLVRVLISNDLAAGDSYGRIRALARLNNALDRNAATMIVAALRDGAVMAPTASNPDRRPRAGRAVTRCCRSRRVRARRSTAAASA